MFTGNFDLIMFQAILPEILIFLVGLVILVLELVLPEEQHGVLGWVTAAGLFLGIAISLMVALPGSEPLMMWGGMVRHDWLGFVFKMLFLFAAAMTALFVRDYKKIGQRGEFYLLLLVSTIGMCLMASAADLIMLYLAIETTSIPLYALAGFMNRDDKSTEAGFKYLLFGAMTSAVMLYGFSLLYGFAGTTSIYDLALGIQAGSLPTPALVGSLLLVLVGFGFKISAVPLHFWAPDVYDGSPTPIAGFLSTASKAAGFAVLARFLLVVYPEISLQWGSVISALAVATMTLGNLLALAQRNIKRMLAYSSIAHAGYALIGVVAATNPETRTFGIASVVFYLLAYVITNLAAFGVVGAFGRISGSDEIANYAGLSRRAPGLSLAMMVAFLSLSGMPPLGGFISKFFIFAAAIQANMVWLAVIGVLNSIIGLYYYLTVLKVVYLYRSDEEDQPLPVTRSLSLSLWVLTIGVVLIGTIFGPWFGWATAAARAMGF